MPTQKRMRTVRALIQVIPMLLLEVALQECVLAHSIARLVPKEAMLQSTNQRVEVILLNALRMNSDRKVVPSIIFIVMNFGAVRTCVNRGMMV